MTPFRIRDRVKALFSRAPTPVEDEPLPRYRVDYRLPDGTTQHVDATKGDTLVLASGRTEWPIDTGCADTSCATCQVDVLTGEDALTRPTDRERETLQRNGAPPDRRLGCRAKIMGPGIAVGMVNVLGWSTSPK